MTSKQVYEATAIELNKKHAPTIKLYEFNYFFNQAIHLFVNKVYNIYDINQQTTDDLRVLKATATLFPKQLEQSTNTAINYLHKGTYIVEMPDDYLHLLNCICLFNVNNNKECWNKGDVMVVGATKLTADSWANIIDDVYNRPSNKHPYYYIHNQNNIKNESNIFDLPTNFDTDKLHTLNYTTDKENNITKEGESNFSRTFNFKLNDEVISYSTVNKPAGSRYANPSKVRIEIRCGKDDSIFKLSAVQIDYIKAPQFIELTQEQLDSDLDISQVMEFPDYVNQEIINELVNLIMRKANDPGLYTHILMTLSIARPTGQLQQPAAQG